jgi:hypothetical protein
MLALLTSQALFGAGVGEAWLHLNRTAKHSYTTLVVLLMVAQPSWLRAQAGGLCHQDFPSGTVPSSCGLI